MEKILKKQFDKEFGTCPLLGTINGIFAQC
jgi:hypothetical protein